VLSAGYAITVNGNLTAPVARQNNQIADVAYGQR